MINGIKASIIFSVTFVLSCFVNIHESKAQGFLRADGKKIVNENNENILLRGVGLGGWMLQEGYMLGINNEGQQHKIKQRITDLVGEQETKVFYNNWLSNHTRKADVDSMKAWGFNSVRLPMHYNLYTLSIEEEPVKGQNTWLEKGFSMTDSLLAWCKANKMYLILDLHAAPGGQGNDFNISDRDPSKPSLWDSEANQQKTIALWRKLAERYANEPWIGAYDIINEPNWGFEDPTNDKNGLKEKKNAPLRKLMLDITKAIREVDQKHIVIIEGNGWGNNYNGIFPLWDNNMALSFHKYWAYNDQASAKGMITIRDEHNVPIWLGETGENSNVWFTEAIRLFEKNNIGWAWWPLKKLGNNNPIQVKSNHEYDVILNYWKGDGAKPTAEVAKSGLKKLAHDLKIENGIIHYDVIDAMMRQPFSNETKPFKNNTIKKNTTIYAVDYDLGINGIAYFDKDTADYHVSTGINTAGNKGRVYRNDGVDISRTPNDSYYVSHIETGEWLQYTIDVESAGVYTIVLNVAAKDANGRLSIAINGRQMEPIVNVPNTGDYTTFKTVQLKKIKLNAGKQKLKVFANAGGFNFNYIRFIE
ncbi:cellulase family glycosylhydrolase [Pedobacter foliorum]|uniref:cellulase family glycosylhydrolase n=1 Tax=Pedobacter foliorum TaxID=2739058 RepID=UPI0015674488|nr:cellulase family glycosylhydrolase [Pedobacter foliorum]NRF40266.1 cellulase family glycosylhydrolase [Pedobacter foliorum]